MARVRFATAKEVFETFPAIVDDMRAGPAPDGPVPYLQARAASPTPEDALTFAAYSLGRREGVWWACRCVREIRGGLDGEDAAVVAAETWVREPEEGNRRAALALGMSADRRRASTWLALAAGWSGGNISLVEGPAIPSQPHMTPKAARAAVLIALATASADARTARLRMCVDEALQLMDDKPR